MSVRYVFARTPVDGTRDVMLVSVHLSATAAQRWHKGRAASLWSYLVFVSRTNTEICGPV